jgi:hypothetical protein
VVAVEELARGGERGLGPSKVQDLEGRLQRLEREYLNSCRQMDRILCQTVDGPSPANDPAAASHSTGGRTRSPAVSPQKGRRAASLNASKSGSPAPPGIGHSVDTIHELLDRLNQIQRECVASTARLDVEDRVGMGGDGRPMSSPLMGDACSRTVGRFTQEQETRLDEIEARLKKIGFMIADPPNPFVPGR